MSALASGEATTPASSSTTTTASTSSSSPGEYVERFPLEALAPFLGLAVLGAFAVGDPDACRLADLAARNASQDRIARWGQEARAALGGDRVECECCGSLVAAVGTVVRGRDRLCRDCAADLDGDDERAGREAAPPVEGEGLRAGAAAMLGLCEECGEDAGDCDACHAGADLSRANLAGADLAGAYLAGACLAGAYLMRANLAGADLEGANLEDACHAGDRS